MDRRRRGLTLLEMTLVVAVLAVVAGIVLPNLSVTQDNAALTTTRASLVAIRDVVGGTSNSQRSYRGDLGGLPVTLRDLYVLPPGLPAPLNEFDPRTRRGWRGPYLTDASTAYVVDPARGFTSAYGSNGDPMPSDAWSHSIALQVPTQAGLSAQDQVLFSRLVSAGPDGIIETPLNKAYPEPSERGDDLLIFINRADIAPE